MPLRTSRPKPIAAFAPKYTAVAAQTTCTSVISSISAPVDQMYAVSPVTTPLSMMSALRLGRYSAANVCAVCRINTEHELRACSAGDRCEAVGSASELAGCRRAVAHPVEQHRDDLGRRHRRVGRQRRMRAGQGSSRAADCAAAAGGCGESLTVRFEQTQRTRRCRDDRLVSRANAEPCGLGTPLIDISCQTLFRRFCRMRTASSSRRSNGHWGRSPSAPWQLGPDRRPRRRSPG